MRTRLGCLMAALAIMLVGSEITPSSYAQNRMAQIITLDNSSGAFLGIRMTDVTKENMSDYNLDRVEGVIVQSVVEGSPAESADLKKDDVLLEFDGLKVRSTMQFSRLVKETPVGRELEIMISRAGKQKNVTVKLGQQDEREAGMDPGVLPEILRAPGNRDFLFRLPVPPERDTMTIQRTPRLGVTLQPLPEQLAEHLGVPGEKGVLVASVAEDSPSFGKLKAGDVIIQAEGKDIVTREDLAELVRREGEGSITFKVIRDKKEVTVTINMPAESGKKFRL